jgi:hypothetical protein
MQHHIHIAHVDACFALHPFVLLALSVLLGLPSIRGVSLCAISNATPKSLHCQLVNMNEDNTLLPCVQTAVELSRQ